jgi:hypothetical protein
MKATVGSRVLYKLTEQDAAGINVRRAHFKAHQTLIMSRPDFSEIEPGQEGRSGHIGHSGNDVAEGDVYPADVVRTFLGTTVNLQVHLDGNDHYWATSRSEGEGPGFWSWPSRAEHEAGDRPPRY